MSFLLSVLLSVSYSHSVGVTVPCMRWVTQASALGIPVLLIILRPWDTAHCKLGHQIGLVKEPQIHSLALAPFLFSACISIRSHHLISCYSLALTGRFRINVSSSQRVSTVVLQIWDWLIDGGGKLWNLLTAANYPHHFYSYFIVWKGRGEKKTCLRITRLASGWLVVSQLQGISKMTETSRTLQKMPSWLICQHFCWFWAKKWPWLGCVFALCIGESDSSLWRHALYQFVHLHKDTHAQPPTCSWQQPHGNKGSEEEGRLCLTILLNLKDADSVFW